ncbi:hypothetical protein [Ruegeria hyattellae]|uniref:hypothetical protein n=1 Tax=Ruegeria hyattellae TaxID=3233337 RepID=UPI00355BC6DD
MRSAAITRMKSLAVSVLVGLILLARAAAAADVADFVGDYTGSAEMLRSDGTLEARDMSVSISETRNGFNVSWTTVAFKHDGRVKEQAFSIDFIPTDRSDVFSAAMKRNVFGHEVQLDPMKGEPFVWGRIWGDTLTIYSLFIDDEGGYEMQQFDRTLTKDGLDLNFSRVREGVPERSINTMLKKK